MKQLLEFSIINIDKPSGPTSFQVDKIIKNKLNLKKTSHFGTLDPKVTGVLPVALNRACKLLRWFMKKNKTYVGIMKLHRDIKEEELKKEMQKFVGKIKQLPPVKSRVKREERIREVYSWEILEISEKNVLFECEVEAGTYIRKLVHDLGLKIGGAHMSELRRTKAGIFEENESINLYELDKAIKENKLREIIIPAEEAIKKILPSLQVKKKKVRELLTGKPIFKKDVKDKIKDDEIAVFCRDKFIGVYRKVNEGEIILRPEFVFS